MFKPYITLCFIICFFASIVEAQQPDFNAEFIGQLDYAQDCNDVWGYVDSTGTEYAILGTTSGTAIISLADHANPQEILFIPGTNSIWRDIKSWKNYLYVVADRGSDGLLIIDMSDPLNPTYEFQTSFTGAEDFNLRTTHNVFMDEFGVLYLAGSNVNSGGIVMLDVDTDGSKPSVLGFARPEYSHDCYARNNILYSAEINIGEFSIQDISDKQNPIILGTQSTSLNFTHNVWLSEDEQTLYTTDERENAYMDVYDVSDPTSIEKLDRYLPPSTIGKNVIPHNAHFLNGYIITSWYTDGVKIIDGNNPRNLVEVGSYDSWLNADGGFNGNWGAYPYLPSGHLIISDISGGLIVLEPNYQRASYVEGHITDALYGTDVANVEVKILNDRPNLNSSENDGNYKSGIAFEGPVSIKFTHPLYRDTIIDTVLIQGAIVPMDVQLMPIFENTNFTNVVKDADGNPLPDAIVEFKNRDLNYVNESLTDSNGMILDPVLDMPFTVNIGKWGYSDTTFQVANLNDISGDIVLTKGYQDRFIVDNKWTVQSTATLGQFERAVPIATIYDQTGELVNPDGDSPDLGDECYVTGPLGGFPWSFDVDNGFTAVISPEILISADVNEVSLNLDYWFSNIDLSDPTNDSLSIFLLDAFGDVHFVLSETNSDTIWRQWENIDLLPFIPDSTFSFQVAFFIEDASPGNFTEGAVDNIKINISSNVATSELEIENVGILIYPNPTSHEFTLDAQKFDGEITLVEIRDVQGRLVSQNKLNSQNANQVISTPFNAGLYLVNIFTKEGQVYTKKLMIK